MAVTQDVDAELQGLREEIGAQFPGLDLQHICGSCSNAVVERPHESRGFDCGNQDITEDQQKLVKQNLLQKGKESWAQIQNLYAVKSSDGEELVDNLRQIIKLEEQNNVYLTETNKGLKSQLSKQQRDLEKLDKDNKKLTKQTDQQKKELTRSNNDTRKWKLKTCNLEASLAFVYQWAKGVVPENAMRMHLQANNIDIENIVIHAFGPEVNNVEGELLAGTISRQTSTDTNNLSSALPSPLPPTSGDNSGGNEGNSGRQNTGSSPHSGAATRGPTGGAEGEVIDGKAVSRSLKIIQCRFSRSDDAISHLRKEQVILQDIRLYFDDVNQGTKVAIIVALCDETVQDVSTPLIQSTRLGVKNFLEQFRTRRFPNFHALCMDHYRSLKQSKTESVMDFLQRFRYLLQSMGKDPQEFVDDFLEKLFSHHIRWDIERSFYGNGKYALEVVAQHADALERVYSRRFGKRLDLEDARDTEDAGNSNDGDSSISASVLLGARNTGNPPSFGKQASTPQDSAREYLRRMDFPLDICFHCGTKGHRGPNFRDNNDPAPCRGKPCIFCQKSGTHHSFRCYSRPETKAEFDAAWTSRDS